MNKTLPIKCPLCHSQSCQYYWHDKTREFHQCQHCHLVFVPPRYHLSRQEEKAEYDKHNNTCLNEGYRRFLNRTLEPLLAAAKSHFDSQSINNNISGLDFGCGEGAFLSQMAKEQGVSVENYDLYYHPNKSALAQQYHFVVMTEVLEHLAQPATVIRHLVSLLKPKGILAIMTKRVLDQEAFTTWHYKNDPTHICFYSESTFEFIASEYGLSLEVMGNDVVFLYVQRCTNAQDNKLLARMC